MKRNYIGEINTKALNEDIDKFMWVHNIEPYIIMNRDTMRLLSGYYLNSMPHAEDILQYYGNTILFDDSLPLGTIDIR